MRPPSGAASLQSTGTGTELEGVRPVDVFTAAPIQYDCSDMPFYGKEFFSCPKFIRNKSEDCLYLNIWCPPIRENHKTAVAVWIHGGAFHHGWASSIETDGTGFCRRDVILVTIEYRLGVFGFLPVAGDREENSCCGNYGLLDQLAAIRWVKENIEAFGGDPENITIMGQSAGAISCQCLCNTSYTKGLFQRAIFHSGAGIGSKLDIEISMEYGLEVYKKLLNKGIFIIDGKGEPGSSMERRGAGDR